MKEQELLIYSDNLHREASKMLDDSGVINLLKKYGEVNLHGGYSYNLLLKLDVDIHLIIRNCTEEKVRSLLKEIFDENLFVEILYSDHDRHNLSIKKNTGREYPKGYFIGLKYFFQGKMWNIDVFILSREQVEIYNLQKYFDFHCSENTRHEILKSKMLVLDKNITYPAKKIYDLYISGKVKNIKEFKRYLKNERISI